MRSSFAKSIYFGAAILAFAGVSATATNASAKSKVTTGAYTALKTNENVTMTGSNAVYTKPGTMKGAKVVASTTTTKALASSTNAKKANFRAYGYKVTNRGSVYYRVVSFDKTYRGYIYGGKSTSAFAGGVATYATTKDATTPSATQSYTLSANTSSTENTLFYKAPTYTQYKIGRAVVNGAVLAKTDAYAKSSFTFGKAVTTSREGDLWYQIASVNGSTKDGLVGSWIKASNVKTLNASDTENNTVTVNYVDQNNNKVATSNFVINSTQTRKGDKASANFTNTDHQNLSEFILADASSNSALKGYKLSSKDNDNVTATTAATLKTDPSKATNALIGGSITVHVYGVATSALNLTVATVNNQVRDADGKLVNVENTLHMENGKSLSVGDSIDGAYTSDVDGLYTDNNRKVSATDMTTSQDVLTGTTHNLDTGNNDGTNNEIINYDAIYNALFSKTTGTMYSLVGNKTYLDQQGFKYHYVFLVNSNFDQAGFKSANAGTHYGQAINVRYNAVLVKGQA